MTTFQGFGITAFLLCRRSASAGLSLAAGQLGVAESGFEMAKVDLVARFELGPLHPFIVDERAIGRIEVHHFIETVRLSEQFRMEAGDPLVFDQDFVSSVAPEAEPIFDQVENELVSVVEIERQIGHGTLGYAKKPIFGLRACLMKEIQR